MENASIDSKQKKQLCEQHMHRYVMVQTNEGWCFDGIVEHVDDEVVCIAVPYCPSEWDNRAFIPFGGFGGGFGGYGGYPYPRRRFYRRAFPLGTLLALSLLPYYF